MESGHNADTFNKDEPETSTVNMLGLGLVDCQRLLAVLRNDRNGKRGPY